REGRRACRGGGRCRHSAVARGAGAHPAQHPARPHGAGEPVDRRRHHRRGGAVLPRPRPAAAVAVLGQHAQRGAALSRQCAVDGGVARAGDLPHRAVVQPARRRPARRPRSARAVTRPLRRVSTGASQPLFVGRARPVAWAAAAGIALAFVIALAVAAVVVAPALAEAFPAVVIAPALAEALAAPIVAPAPAESLDLAAAATVRSEPLAPAESA